MIIKELKDVEAFLMMLRLILRMLFKNGDEKLIRYAYKFCEVDKKPFKLKDLLRSLNNLLNEHQDFMNDKSCIQIKMSCIKRIGEDKSDELYCLIVKCDQEKSIELIKLNQTKKIEFKIQNNRIRKASIEIRILKIIETETNRSISKMNKKKILLDDTKIDLNQIDLFDGINICFKYDEIDKKYSQSSLTNISNSVESIFIKKLNLLIQYPDFNFSINWIHFDPTNFSDLDQSIEEELIKYHQKYINRHLRLLKYILLRKINRIEYLNLIYKTNVSNTKFDPFIDDEELKEILKQNLFDGSLNLIDHSLCIKRVLIDLKNEQLNSDNIRFKKIKFDQLIERIKLLNYKSEDQASSASASQEEDFGSLLINPFEFDLNKDIPADLPFAIKNMDKNSIPDKAMKTYSSSGSMDNKKKIVIPFNIEKMCNQFIDDIDMNTDNVVIWISLTLTNMPRFYRFGTEKTFNLFDYNQGFRKLCIQIYTSKFYKFILNVMLILEFICFSTMPLEDLVIFLPLHIYDSMITIIAKGFIFNRYSYMSNFWYYGHGLLIITYISIFFIRNFTTVNSQIDNYLVGLSMLSVMIRCVIRTLREIKNGYIFTHFGVLLTILGKVIIELIPLIIFTFFVIMFASIFAMNTMNDMFNYICFPNEFDYKLFDSIASETMENNFLNDSFNFAEQGEFRMNINQTYFLYDYRPCSVDPYPFAHVCTSNEKCMRISDQSLRFLSRHPPDFLTFDDKFSTFILILTMIFNENSNVYFYRIVEHTGIYGYIFCVLLHIFGFYILSLLLALIYDSYDYYQVKHTANFHDKIKFFENEDEFSFIPKDNFLIRCDMKVAELNSNPDLHDSFESDPILFKNRSIETKLNEKDQEIKIEELLKFIKEFRRSKSSNLLIQFLKQYKKFQKYCQNLELNQKKWFNFFIEYIIWAKFVINLCFFQLEQPIDYALRYQSLITINYLFFIDYLLTLIMTIEILFKIFIFGHKFFFSKLINIFDTIIVFMNIISFIIRLTAYSRNARYLSPFNYLRILGVWFRKWRLLRIAGASIKQAKNEIYANCFFYFLIFIFLNIFSYRFMNTFVSDRQEEDLLQPDVNFNDFYGSFITIFYVLFKFDWMSVASNYHIFNRKTNDGYPMFILHGQEFIELLPFIVETFLIISIFVHLFFRELFVPQLIHYLDISKLLQIKPIHRPNAQILNINPWQFFKRKNFAQYSNQFKFDIFFNRKNLLTFYRNSCKIFLRINFFMEILNFIYFLTRDYFFHSIRIPNNQNQYSFLSGIILFLGLVFQFYFSINLVLTQIKIFYENKLKGETSYYVQIWRILGFIFEFSMLIFSTIDIIYQYKYDFYLDRPWIFEFIIWIGLIKIVFYFPTIRDNIKLFILNISVLSQCIFLVIGLLTFMAFIGSSLFKNRLQYCLVANGNWFYQKAKPIGLTNYIYDEETKQIACLTTKHYNDVFNFHQLQIRVDKFPHFFNFDSIFNSIETIFHITNGADLSTIQLISSIKEFNEKEKNFNFNFWPFISLILFLGILLDAFLFAIINEIVIQSLPIEKLFIDIRNKQMRSVYLALDYIKYLVPWENYDYQKRWSIDKKDKYINLLMKIVSSESYKKVQIFILISNILFNALQWNFNLKNVDLIENLFLINYLLTGILKLNLIQKDLFLYPTIIIFEILLPLICYTLFVSGLRITTRLEWSTILFLRVLIPEYYLQLEFLRSSNIIIKAIKNSFIFQIYLIAILFFFIICFSKIGLILFGHLDYNSVIFQPNQMPYFYSSFFYSFIHLTSNAFTGNYDMSSTLLRVRNQFCLKVNPYHRFILMADKEIVKQIEQILDYNYDFSRNEFLNQSLVKCDIDLASNILDKRTKLAFEIKLKFRSKIDQVTQRLLKICKDDNLTAINSDYLLNCDAVYSTVLKKRIDFMKEFKMQISIEELNENLLGQMKTVLTYEKILSYYNRTKNNDEEIHKEIERKEIAISDQYLQKLEKLCDDVKGYQSYTINRIDDNLRTSNYSKIFNWIRLKFINVFRTVSLDRSMIGLNISEFMCTRKSTINTFYIIFHVISRIIILNFLKAILFKRYELEKLRSLNNFSNLDIQMFINCWKEFKEKLNKSKKSIYDQIELNDYLPVDHVINFVKNICPTKFRIDVQNDESCLYILSKYSIRCVNVNRPKMHLLDVMSICIAIHMNCSPTIFRQCYPLIIDHLDIFIIRTFPTYKMDQQADMNSLESIVRHHYLTKLFVLNELIS